MDMKKLKWFVLGIAGTGAFAALADLSAPVAAWRMDRLNADGYIPDETRGSNHLELGGGCMLTNDVSRGITAVYFNGNSNAWALALQNTLFTGSRSISMWVCRAADEGPLDPAVNKIPYLIRDVSGTGVNYGYGSTTYALCPTMGVNSYNIVTATRLEWHHLVFVVEQTETEGVWNLRSYLDGGEDKSFDARTCAVNTSTSQKILIGNTTLSNGLATRPFHGMIADVRIYDTALFAVDARAIYMEHLRARRPYLVGHWKMDALGDADGSGDRVVDPEGMALASLKSYGLEIVPDGVCGTALNFPEAAGAAAWVTLPADTYGVSFGIWLNIATNLTDTSLHNTLPHVYTVYPCGRMCIEGAGKNVTDNRAHVFDTGTLNDGLDQGFWCSDITMEKGRWSHLGITYEMKPDAETGVYGVEPRIYVDGSLVSTGRWVTAANLLNTYLGVYPKNATICLGNNGNGKTTARSFGGPMDEFMLFEGVLSAAQMAELAAGLPEVSAGEDFTVAAETARLSGSVGLTGTLANRPAAKVTSAWRVVATPAGGEGASFLHPDDLRTTVTLPVEGVYTFRLTIADGFGRTATSDVTVTRIAVPSANTPPAVSVSGSATASALAATAFTATATDADNGPDGLRVSWKVVSGPDAVRFEPAQGLTTKATFFGAGTYRIAAVASDGAAETVSVPHEVAVTAADAISLTNGLIAYWPFNASKRNEITGAGYGVNHTAVKWETGVDGHGIRVYGEFYPYLDTQTTLLETIDHDFPGATSDDVPLERYRAFSCWIYHDSSDTNNSSHAAIVVVPYTLGLWYNCEDTRGFSLYQQTLNTVIGGSGGVDVYGCPAVDPINRWTHVYALFDRRTSYANNTSELWIDGVKQTNRTTHGMGGGRVKATGNILIGGHNKETYPGNNGHFDNRSRTFPGFIDEVRMYNRALTEAEIKYLANNPVVDVRRPPAVSGEPDKLSPAVRKVQSIEVQVNTESYPESVPLTYAWCVLSGDSSKLVFADATARATTVTARTAGRYVIQLAVTGGTRTVYSTPITLDIQQAGTFISLK